MGYTPKHVIESIIQKAERNSHFLRPFSRILPQVEWRKEREVQSFTIPLQGDHKQYGQNADGTWYVPEGTVCHHPQVSIVVTNNFRGNRRLTLLNSEELYKNPACHVLIHPRHEDNLVTSEMDTNVQTPRVKKAQTAYDLAKSNLLAACDQIEERCMALDPGYAGFVLAANIQTRGRDDSKEEARNALRGIRNRVENELYSAQDNCERELEKAREELYKARRGAWTHKESRRDVRSALLKTLKNHGVFGMENQRSLLEQMTDGLTHGSFALYELKNQEEADAPVDCMAVPMDSTLRPLDLSFDTLLEAIRGDHMNLVKKSGRGYFAFCVSTHDQKNPQDRLAEYHSTQGVCLVGRVYGEDGGYAVILPLSVWRAIVTSVDICLFHDLPKQVFGITGHFSQRKRPVNRQASEQPEAQAASEAPVAEQPAEAAPIEAAAPVEAAPPDAPDSSDGGPEEPPPATGGPESAGPEGNDGANAAPVEAAAPTTVTV